MLARSLSAQELHVLQVSAVLASSILPLNEIAIGFCRGEKVVRELEWRLGIAAERLVLGEPTVNLVLSQCRDLILAEDVITQKTKGLFRDAVEGVLKLFPRGLQFFELSTASLHEQQILQK